VKKDLQGEAISSTALNDAGGKKIESHRHAVLPFL